jgi:hypothetical protein
VKSGVRGDLRDQWSRFAARFPLSRRKIAFRKQIRDIEQKKYYGQCMAKKKLSFVASSAFVAQNSLHALEDMYGPRRWNRRR